MQTKTAGRTICRRGRGGAGGQNWLCTPRPIASPPSCPPSPCRTCAKKPRVLRWAWSILLMKSARSCWRVSAQPLTLRQVCPGPPRSRSVSRDSSAARAKMGPASAEPAARGRGSAGSVEGDGVRAEVSPHPSRDGALHAGTRQEPSSPPRPPLLPRRAPRAQCKGEERGVIATLAPARPGQHNPGQSHLPRLSQPPPDSCDSPHASPVSRRRGPGYIPWDFVSHPNPCKEPGSPKPTTIPAPCPP